MDMLTLVEVVWLDAWSCDRDEYPLTNARKHMPVSSVGYLLNDDEDQVTIAASLNWSDGDNADPYSVRDVLHVPRGMVLDVRVLAPKD